MTLGELGTSDALVGSAEVMAQAPWLCKFVQFFISWAVIIGFLMYYFSYLCSLVFLANKEFFETVDALKKGGEGGSSGKRMNMKAFLKAFQASNGGEGKKFTGIDNLVVFVMMLAPNFKAYSMYADAKKEDSGEDKEGGNRFSYSDTMGQFFLKSLPQAVLVLFILGMALSGLLLQILFQLSDVLTVQAQKFANTNLQAWIDKMDPRNSGYFSFKSMDTPLGDVCDDIAVSLLASVTATSAELTDDEREIIVQNIEGWVRDNFVADSANPYNVSKLVAAYDAKYGTAGQQNADWTGPNGRDRINVSHDHPEDLALQTGFSATVRFLGSNDRVTSPSKNMTELCAPVAFSQIANFAVVDISYDLAKIRNVGGRNAATAPAEDPLVLSPSAIPGG